MATPERATGPAAAAAAPLVVVEQLVKRYPKSQRNAVDGVTFEMRRGEVFGLLGPNGAGKTTTVGVLTTRVRPTGGRAWIAGHDVVASPVAARRALGVVPQRNNLDRSLSARQNLLFHALYFGVPVAERVRRADRLLDDFGLGDRGSDRVDRYSGGMAQRLMIARALMHDPQVLFLDEPTTGLDPQARLFVWDRIGELRKQGVTILLTTHDMDEASLLADRVAIMDHGKLLVLDRPAALTALVPGTRWLEVTVSGLAAGDAADGWTPARLAGELGSLEAVQRVEQVAGDGAPGNGAPSGWGTGGVGGWGAGPAAFPAGGAAAAPAAAGQTRLRLYATADPASLIAPVVERLSRHGLGLEDLRLGDASLEDVFIHLTGRTLR